MPPLDATANQVFAPLASHETTTVPPVTTARDAVVVHLDLDAGESADRDQIEDAALLLMRELGAFGLVPISEHRTRVVLARPLPAAGHDLVAAIETTCAELRELVAMALGTAIDVSVRVLPGLSRS